MSSSLNIILFGETGVGKSSVINLIAGSAIAETSPDAPRASMSSTPHTFDVDGRTFRIWETLRFHEPEMAVTGHLPAVKQACDLIHHLTNEGGVDLLLFCIRGNRVIGTMKNDYRFFYDKLCGSKVPIALIITHLEKEDNMEDWWEKNQDDLQRQGIEVVDHACVAGLPSHRKYEESRTNINRLLREQNGVGRFTMSPEDWCIGFFSPSGPFAPMRTKLKRKDFVKVLMERGKLDQKGAEAVASKLEEGDATIPRRSSPLNIVVFGETGVGTSSVVNLIAGSSIAETSPDAKRCTMSSKSYDVDVNGRILHIWDTVGLEEQQIGTGTYLPAIEQACGLIRQLTRRGGVDLLLFCIRGNRVTATTQSNYRLFYEVLCGSKVPIALVITHLEREEQMEDWWVQTQGSLEKYGIKSAGHACVTGLPSHRKYEESRANIKKLLQGHNDDGRFTMPPEGWFIEFLRMLGVFSPPKLLKRRDVVKVLTKRCSLDPKLAEDIADKLVKGTATG